MSTRPAASEPAASQRLDAIKRGLTRAGLDPSQQDFLVEYAFDDQGNQPPNVYINVPNDLINVKRCDIVVATCWFTLRAFEDVTEQITMPPPKIIYTGVVDDPNNPNHDHPQVPQPPPRYHNVFGFVSREYDNSGIKDVSNFFQLLKLIIQTNTQNRSLDRVAVIYRGGDPCGDKHFAQINTAFNPQPPQTITKIDVAMLDDTGLANAITQFINGGDPSKSGIIVPPSQFALKRRDWIIRTINAPASTYVPAVYPNRVYVESGGLASYGPVLLDQYEAAGDAVAGILTNPSSFNPGFKKLGNFEPVGNTTIAHIQGIQLPTSVVKFPP